MEIRNTARPDVIQRNSLLRCSANRENREDEGAVKTCFYGPRCGVNVGPGECAAYDCGDEGALFGV